ncbi:hypothetical protein MMC30_001495, partial [Trapelia coarctata]|nr:hypothetical protein [Trapelia coarctata]
MDNFKEFEMKNTGASASISEDVQNSIDDVPGTIEMSQSTSQDHKDMARLGKKQEFR